MYQDGHHFSVEMVMVTSSQHMYAPAMKLPGHIVLTPFNPFHQH